MFNKYLMNEQMTEHEFMGWDDGGPCTISVTVIVTPLTFAPDALLW